MAPKDNFRFFRLEARDLLARIDQAMPDLTSPAGDSRRAAVERLVYLTHTLKGAAAVVGLKDIAAAAYGMETLLRAQPCGHEMPSPELLGQLAELLAQVNTGVATLIPAPAPAPAPARSDR